MGEFREQIRKEVAGAAKKQVVKRGAGIVRIKRQIANRSLDQILEEVSSKGQFREVVSFLPRYFDQHRGVVDVGVGDRYAKLDVSATAPTPGSHQHELPFGQQLIQFSDGATDVAHCVLIGQLAVALEINVDDMGDV